MADPRRKYPDLAHLPAKEYRREYNRRKVMEWRRATGKGLASDRLKKYGVTAEQVEAMMEEQVGACAICEDADPQDLDHDHKTGKVRGLLCRSCNMGLGMLKDDPVRLEKAIAYLAKHGTVKVA